MLVVDEPMGIEAAEKPLVGTPGGDHPTTLISAFTFPVALHPSFFPSSRSVSSLPSAESYESTKADRTLLSCKFLPLLPLRVTGVAL